MSFDPTILLSGPLGGVLGFVGNLISNWDARQTKLLEHRMNLEELKIKSELQVQSADLDLRKTVEDRAGESFTEAIKAQAALTGASNWVKDTMTLFRPGLTILLQICATGLALWRGGDALDIVIISTTTQAGGALGFWFGQRSSEKALTMQISKVNIPAAK